MAACRAIPRSFVLSFRVSSSSSFSYIYSPWVSDFVQRDVLYVLSASFHAAVVYIYHQVVVVVVQLVLVVLVDAREKNGALIRSSIRSRK